MSILENLQQASFRNIDFYLINTSTITGGRKTVVHEFINSSIRNVEDLGKDLKTYSLTGIIYGTDSDYFTNRDRLIQALDKSGKGSLIHPYFGNIEVVLTAPYTITIDETRLGEVEFQMEFKIANDKATPKISNYNTNTISTKSKELINKLVTNFGDNVAISSGNITGFEDISTKINDLTDKIENISDLFVVANINSARLNSDLTNLNSSIATILTSPLTIAQNIQDIFSKIQVIQSTALERLNTFIDLFTYNNTSKTVFTDIPDNNSISNFYAEQLTNENYLTLQVRVSALSESYSQLAQSDFEIQDNLDIYIEQLETEYFSIVNNLDYTTKGILQDLRFITLDFLNNQRTELRKIISLDVQRMPVQKLCYLLYNNFDDLETIRGLNTTKIDLLNYKGSTRVLNANT